MKGEKCKSKVEKWGKTGRKKPIRKTGSENVGKNNENKGGWC